MPSINTELKNDKNVKHDHDMFKFASLDYKKHDELGIPCMITLLWFLAHYHPSGVSWSCYLPPPRTDFK